MTGQSPQPSQSSNNVDTRTNIPARINHAAPSASRTNPTVSNLKRKAESGDEGPALKSPRSAYKPLPNRHGQVSRVGDSCSSAKKNAMPGGNLEKPIVTTKTNSSGRLGAEDSKLASSMTKKPATKPSEASGATAKKGSFREIMARAEAAKAAARDLGQIKHKSGQKLSRRARRIAQEQEATKRPKKATALAGQGKRMERGRLQETAGQPAKAKPKRPPLEYKGTMRSSASSSQAQKAPKPSMLAHRSGPKGRASNRHTPSHEDIAEKHYTYAGSDEEDTEGEELEASDEMQGGGFDELEEEEEQSLRVARKEDAEALRQENEHRRLKIERKKKLEQLAAKAPKARY